jgi:peptidoglycan/LPS O-acetylase OafA/YrhL
MKIASLDGLRGVAAILVVLFHENYWFSQTGLVPKAYLAVDFFFCLSGFIIAYSYSEHLISGQLSFLKFSAIRLVRLYPLYLLGTVLGLLRLSVQIAIGHPAAPSISNFSGLCGDRTTVPTVDISKVRTLPGEFPGMVLRI